MSPRLLRSFAAAVVTLGLLLPYSYSQASAPASVVVTANAALDQSLAQTVKVVRAERAHKKKVRIARKRAVRKITTPAYGHISAYFGSSSRLWSARHTGMDIDANYGQSVYNVMKGTVIFTGWGGAYGNLVIVRTERGGDIWYAHLSHISVKRGKTIKSGRIIGAVGATGHVTGAHLHLEVRKYDYPVDPARFLWGNHRGDIKKSKIPSWVYSDRVMHLNGL